MIASANAYTMGANGVPVRCTEADGADSVFASLDEAFGLADDADFDFVF